MRPNLRNGTFRRGWNTALESVVRCLPELAEELNLSGPGRDVLAAVGVMSEGMMMPVKVRPLRNRVLARRFGVNLRTITNWRREGCPFEQSQGKVLAWIAGRRYAPKGTEEKFKDQLSNRRIRNGVAAIKAGFAEIRAIKELHRNHGTEPDDWLKRFRCPKKPKVRVGSM